MGTKTRNTYRTTIVFTLKDKIGALCDGLEPFKTHNINLTRIVSRPHPSKEWQYIFFAEIENRETNPKVRKALKELRNRANTVFVFRSYPVKKI